MGSVGGIKGIVYRQTGGSSVVCTGPERRRRYGWLPSSHNSVVCTGPERRRRHGWLPSSHTPSWTWGARNSLSSGTLHILLIEGTVQQDVIDRNRIKEGRRTCDETFAVKN
jgi:hypothetical protein